jgi:hypothetical protein
MVGILQDLPQLLDLAGQLVHRWLKQPLQLGLAVKDAQGGGEVPGPHAMGKESSTLQNVTVEQVIGADVEALPDQFVSLGDVAPNLPIGDVPFLLLSCRKLTDVVELRAA